MKTKLNVKLLRKVQAHILEEPRRYEQNATIDKGQPGERHISGMAYPVCGTIACIGGWAQLLAKRPGQVHILNFKSIAKTLGLGMPQALRLFAYTWDERGWPEKFKAAYAAAKTPRQRARVAVRRIDHFIKTKGAE